jgi:hypothetical protein
LIAAVDADGRADPDGGWECGGRQPAAEPPTAAAASEPSVIDRATSRSD